jgi:hypothetical protein
VPNDDREWEPVTEEDQRLAAEARAQLKRDLEAARRRPRPPVTSPGKFTEPLGLDENGNLQPPLTPEERAHNEAVRRRAIEEMEAAREARRRGDDQPG